MPSLSRQVQRTAWLLFTTGLPRSRLQVVDRFDHPRIGAAEKVAVGVGAGVFLDDFFPFFRRDFRIGVAFQAESQLVDDCVTRLGQIVHLVLVGRFDVGADQHELFDANLIKSARDRLRGRDGRTAARLLDDVNDRGLMGKAFFHGICGAMENDHRRPHVGKRLGGFDERRFQFLERLAKLAGHAQPGDVRADFGRQIAMKLRLGQAVGRWDNQSDARLGVHSPAAPRL